MNTIQQSITIPADRRISLEFVVPEHIPVGDAELLLVLSPAKQNITQIQKQLHNLAGCFAESKTFAGDPVELQKACRDEW